MRLTRFPRWLVLPAAAVVTLSAAQFAGASAPPAETTPPAPPATEAPAPGTMAPGTEAPGTDAPGSMAPGTEAPGTEAPGSAAPGTEAPASDAVGTEAPAGEPRDVDLSGVCPETVVIQTDWNPEAEHGPIYELIGPDPVIDAETVRVSGPLVTSGVDTGVDVEIRSGGPAIGFQTVTSQLYADDSILLGFVYTDEAIQNSGQFPTVAVMSGMEKNPQMIMWDPATYPDITTIADLGAEGVLVRYFGGAAYMEYFVQSGILSPDQVDGSYDGTPAAFVAAGGADAQQGFGSSEPYIYEFEVPDWMRPVAYDYINDAGWENYGQSLATRPENITTYADCFTKLVPILQQATVDYVSDPAETNQLIVDAVLAFDNGWVYTPGVAAFGVEAMLRDGLIANGTDGVMGSFDLDRVNNLIEVARPIYASLGQEPPAELTADDIVTNQFLDPSISLPSGEDTEAPAATAAPEATTAATTADTTAGTTADTTADTAPATSAAPASMAPAPSAAPGSTTP